MQHQASLRPPSDTLQVTECSSETQVAKNPENFGPQADVQDQNHEPKANALFGQRSPPNLEENPLISSPSDPSPNSGHIITIPRDSFTAFRLLYASVHDVSHLSCTVFLGTIPDAWMDISKSSAFVKSKKSTKTSVRKWVRKTSSRVKGSVHLESSLDNSGPDSVDSIPQALLDDQINSSENEEEEESEEEEGGGVWESENGGNGENGRFLDGENGENWECENHRNGNGEICANEKLRDFNESKASSAAFDAVSDTAEPGGVRLFAHLARFTGGSLRSSDSSLTNYLPRHVSDSDGDNESYESCHSLVNGLGKKMGPKEPELEVRASDLVVRRSDVRDNDSQNASLQTAAESQSVWEQKKGSEIQNTKFGSNSGQNGWTGVELDHGAYLQDSISSNNPNSSEPINYLSPIQNIQNPSSSFNAQVHSFSRNSLGQESAFTQSAESNESRNPYTAGPKVSFATFPKQKGSKAKVSFTQPAPETQAAAEALQQEYIRAEKKHHRHMRKFQSFANKASKSTSKAISKKNRLKLKFMDSILKKHKSGDIIRVDRMLVLVKKSTTVHTLTTLSEQKDVDFGILDHWREYDVVLKKTDSVTAPLLAQFFEVKKGRDFNAKPDHKLKVRAGLMCEFYCLSDKTICIADPVDDGLRLFIMNTRFISVAYKWLYMIKEILEEDFFSLLKIDVAGTSVKFQISIPKKLLRESFISSDSMDIIENEQGYNVVKDPLLEYLKEQMTSRIRAISSSHKQLQEWKNGHPQPWFCFKFYDRVEWVPNSGKALFVQSQLLQNSASLELRSMEKTSLSAEKKTDGKKVILTRPYPVEGFLARITNIKGEEYSKLRLFYRIQYFHSADNILFFSKFFRGVPPSPRNMLLHSDPQTPEERVQLRAQIPEIYEKNSFELDSQNHIPWLDSPDFKAYDQEAVEEFSRKIQHLACAEAMIDMCNVKEVREIPVSSIPKHHLYLQSYLWYSSPTILEDMEIMDCGFEMELSNGSCVKLLAPSKAMKKEWIRRLKELAEYWRCHSENVIESQICTKLSNQSKFLIDDTVDSNVNFGSQSIEIAHSFANGHLFTNASMAMSTAVLAAGPIFQKQKKHASFVQYYMVLCPGFLIIFSLYRRSKVSGLWKKTPYYERYMTIPINECYVYAESNAQLDLLETNSGKTPGESVVPRLYPDGWKSSENDSMRSFSLWFGGKRTLRRGILETQGVKNPGLVHMARKSGVTGKILVFQARSRQEREMWVYNILQEINRNAE